MPPKPVLTSSFSVTDANNEVACPLKNQDGSNCRKRCLGEKRFRSMQEHIRRAHPDHYIPKLPATEESFQLMINTPPSQRPQPAPTTAPNRRGPSDASDRDGYGADLSAPPTPMLDEVYPAANAAVALASLHHHNHGSDWDSDVENYSEPELKRERPHHSIELPPLRDQYLSNGLNSRPRELLPSILASSPPGRSSTLPPIQRRDKINRPRKSSVGQNARKAKHEKQRSREFARKLSIDGRKAMSAEPPTAAWVQGKRWEDLIEAATSATEAESDRDLTPIPHSPMFAPALPNSASPGTARLSLPPGFRNSGQYQSYHASPLQKALTPPPPDGPGPNDPEPFPTVESIESAGSGQNFHISRSGLPTSASTNEDSSPLQQHSQLYGGHGPGGINIEVFCASCGRIWLLRDCFACTECIAGVCNSCVNQIISSQTSAQPGYPPVRQGCPKCGVIGGKWKKFQLDFR